MNINGRLLILIGTLLLILATHFDGSAARGGGRGGGGGGRGGGRGGGSVSRGGSSRTSSGRGWSTSKGSKSFSLTKNVQRTVTKVRPASAFSAYKSRGVGAIRNPNFKAFAGGAAVGYLAGSLHYRPYYFYYGGYGYGHYHHWDDRYTGSKICTYNVSKSQVEVQNASLSDEKIPQNVTLMFECPRGDDCCAENCCENTIQHRNQLGGLGILLIIIAIIAGVLIIRQLYKCYKKTKDRTISTDTYVPDCSQPPAPTFVMPDIKDTRHEDAAPPPYPYSSTFNNPPPYNPDISDPKSNRENTYPAPSAPIGFNTGGSSSNTNPPINPPIGFKV